LNCFCRSSLEEHRKRKSDRRITESEVDDDGNESDDSFYSLVVLKVQYKSPLDVHPSLIIILPVLDYIGDEDELKKRDHNSSDLL
jgi:hypothetical protein